MLTQVEPKQVLLALISAYRERHNGGPNKGWLWYTLALFLKHRLPEARGYFPDYYSHSGLWTQGVNAHFLADIYRLTEEGALGEWDEKHGRLQLTEEGLRVARDVTLPLDLDVLILRMRG